VLVLTDSERDFPPDRFVLTAVVAEPADPAEAAVMQRQLHRVLLQQRIAYLPDGRAVAVVTGAASLPPTLSGRAVVCDEDGCTRKSLRAGTVIAELCFPTAELREVAKHADLVLAADGWLLTGTEPAE
jgi:hypothetical protein